jgi:peptide deformylase
MALLKIARMGNPVLKKVADPVADPTDPQIARLAADMIETLEDVGGNGLAAPQVHVSKRVVVYRIAPHQIPPGAHFKPLPWTVLINPVIEPLDDELMEINEGCLSVPDLRGYLKRHASIQVKYLDREGIERVEIKRGLTAGTFQHEVDHLNGALFVDRADPRTLSTWEQFDRHQRAEFEGRARAIVERTGS